LLGRARLLATHTFLSRCGSSAELVRARQYGMTEVIGLPTHHFTATATGDVVWRRYVLLGTIQAESAWAMRSLRSCAWPSLSLLL